MLTSRTAAAAVAWLALVGASQAQEQPQGGAVDALLSCRAIEQAEARLACQDSRLAELAQALDSGRVVLVEREAVRSVERESFGLSLPSIASLGSFFSRDGDDAQGAASAQAEAETIAEDGSVTVYDGSGALDEIRSLPVQRVTTDRYDKVTVYLENGQVWRQTDSEFVGYRSRHLDGLTATIDRGAIGSYFMELSHNGRRFRAERLR